MNDEKYNILDVSEPKTEEEREKVSNSRIVSALLIGTSVTIGFSIAGFINLGQDFSFGDIFRAVIDGVQGLVLGFYALESARTTYDYIKENGFDDESENKTL